MFVGKIDDSLDIGDEVEQGFTGGLQLPAYAAGHAIERR